MKTQILSFILTLSFSVNSFSDETLTLPKIESPSILNEGIQRELTPAQISELLPWSKNSKAFLVDLLDGLQGLNAEDKLSKLTLGIEEAVKESASLKSETFMRFILNRSLMVKTILENEMNEDAVGTIDTKIRLLVSSIEMAIRYYDIDVNVLTKKSSSPYAVFGVEYFDFLKDLNKSIFDASAQYKVERAALELLQWDLYRDLNNTALAPQILKINNGLKLFPGSDKTLKDSQFINYIRQMKNLESQLSIMVTLAQHDKAILERLAKEELARVEKAEAEELERSRAIQKLESDKIRALIKSGATVLLKNNSNEYRVGKIDAIFSDEKIKIIYYFNGSSNEVFRGINDISPKVKCLQYICEGDGVFLKNDSGENRTGTVSAVFTNGMTNIDYLFNGNNNNVYRTISKLDKLVKSQGVFSMGSSIHLYNDSGDDRIGKITYLSTENANIDYDFNGSNNNVYRSLTKVSKETKCVNDICRGDTVMLYNNSGTERTGTISNIFENGRAFVKYYYDGSKNEVWRDVSKLLKQR